MGLNLTMTLIGKDLAIIVNKRHLKTRLDKEILCRAINGMCHLHSFEMYHTPEEIDEFVNDTKGIYLVFMAIGESYEIFYGTRRNSNGSFSIQ